MNGNHVTLVGYVGQHLKSGRSSGGIQRVAIRVATHSFSKSDEGENQYKTVWHDVVVWGKTAIYAEHSFVKGSHIWVEGNIEYRTYFDRAGHKRYATQIKGYSLMNLDR